MLLSKEEFMEIKTELVEGDATPCSAMRLCDFRILLPTPVHLFSLPLLPSPVSDVLVRLRLLARLEAELLFREYKNYPGETERWERG
jgi:hypothetical protein